MRFILIVAMTGIASLCGMIMEQLGGSASETAVPLPTIASLAPEKAILESVDANIEASNAEDVDAYMATIHPDSPLYATTEIGIEQIFDQYDLVFKLIEREVIEVNGDTARAHFVLETIDPSGSPSFNDNRVTGVFLMRLDNGVWKIENQEILDVEYLE